MDVLDKIERNPTGARDVPKKAVIIADCGQINESSSN